MARNNFIKFQDFDIKNLRLCEGKINKSHGCFQMMEIKYVYPDGIMGGLRLRSPALFSYGVFQYDGNTNDYAMCIKLFYDEENPTEKEFEFKKTLDSISEFLRKEVKEKSVVKRKKDDFFDELEAVYGNTFFPKLNQDRTYNKDGKITNNVINTIFYEKNKKGNLEKVKNFESLRRLRCKLIAYIDIEDIFTSPSKIKVRSSISDAVIIKKNVVSPVNFVKTFVPSTEVTLGSDDEE